MADRTDVAYEVGGLRAGAEGLQAVQESADLAAHRLHSASLTGSMFGRTPRAGAYSGAVVAVREAQARGFARESERASDLGQRTGLAAVAGDGLTAATTALAAAVPRAQP